MPKNRSTQNVDCLRCSVNYLCLPKNLNAVEVSELNALITHIKTVEKGAHLFHAGDPMHYLYAVYAGCCKDYWLDENGTQRIDNFYLAGDIIGLESIPNRTHFFSLVALQETQFCA